MSLWVKWCNCVILRIVLNQKTAIMKSTTNLNLNTNLKLTALVVIVSIIIAIGGYFIYISERSKTLQAKEKTLTSIASLKSKQLSSWFLNELKDIQIIASHPDLSEKVKNFIRLGSQANKSKISDYLSIIASEHDYDDVIIASADGKIEIWSGNQFGTLNDVERRTIEKEGVQKKFFSTNLFRHKSNGKEEIFISIISFIKDDDNNVLAALIGRIDASLNVYPIIEEWPIPSQTAESYLFMLENDNIIFLSNLKHIDNAALNLQIPGKNTELLGSHAYFEKLGLVSGKDYHNENSIGYITKIEGTPWYLISEIDKSEMYKGAGVTGRIVAGFMLLLVFMIVFFVTTILNQRQKSIYKKLFIKEKEARQQQEKFKVTMDCLGEGVIVADMDARVQYINKYAEALTGWNYSDALGRNLGEIYPLKNEETGEGVNNILEKIIKHGIVKELANHTLLVLKSGKEIPVMDTGAPIFDTDGSLRGIVIIFQDETEKRHQNHLLKKSEKKFRMLATSIPQKFFFKDCESTYLHCNENFAKDLGISENEITGKSDYDFFPKELADQYRDDDRKILEKGEMTTLEEDYIANDVLYSVRTTKIPVKDENEKTIGLFGIFEDITESKRAQVALLKSKKDLSDYFENDITGDYSATAEGKILKCNPAFARILGYSSPDELVGRSILSFYVNPVEREEFLKIIHASNILKGFEVNLKHKNGSELFCKENIVGVFDESGSLVKYYGYLQDITEQREAEQDLHIRDQLLSSVVNTQQELICRFLPDTTITFANKAYYKLFGMTEKELIGSKFLQFVPESEWEQELSILRSLNTNNPQRTSVSKAFRGDGSEITLEWTDIAIFNEEGEVVEFQSVGHDITEMLKAKQEIIYYSQMQELLRDISSLYINIPVDQVNSEIKKSIERLGRLVASDRAYIFDYDWLNNTCSNTIEWCQDGIEPQIQVLQNISLNEIPHWVNKHRNGQIFSIPDVLKLDANDGVRQILEPQGVKSLLTVPIMDENECIGFLGFDSVRKHHSYTKSEEKFLSFFAQLILNVRNRQILESSLVLEKEKAEESDNLKTAFINNISHEVRTPLNAILGFGQFLADQELPAEERREFFKHVEKSSKRLINLFTDYIDMAMLVSNTIKVQKKEFKLEPFFLTITEKAKALCLAKNLKFEVTLPNNATGLTVYSDPELIQKILDKLIDNALKFTKEGSITCGIKIKAENIELFVKDTGNGIAEGKEELIFQMFRQADVSNTRGYEGSGLGLTISNGLVKLLGGQMNVSSEKGKGSVFSFTLPLKNFDKSISSDATNTTIPKSTKKTLILIAEDDKSNYKYLAVILRLTGYQHIHAANGAEAVDFCRQNPDISIVLMDIKMPVMNGEEATKQIRVFRPELPIIATTAYAQTGDENRFHEAGFNDYLPKPIKKEKLLSIITKYII